MLMPTSLQIRSKPLTCKSFSPPGATQQGAFADPIARMGPTMAFARNAEIFGEGEAADYLYKVASGAVRTYRVLADGRRQIGAFYLPGDLFGLETGEEHTFSAEAVSHAKIVVIKRSALMGLAERDSEVARELWSHHCARVAACSGAPPSPHQTAKERVVGFLLEMAPHGAGGSQIELPMSRQDIADYLGLTIETVSRTLTELENTAAIELSTARRIVLRNRTALGRLNA
jgi:CRP-like cAMP-binding protein